MSENKNNSKLILFVVVATLLVAAGYFGFMNKKATEAVAPVPTTTEVPAEQAESITPQNVTDSTQPEAPLAETPVDEGTSTPETPTEEMTDAEKAKMVPTKTLDLPAAPAPTIPSSEASKDPAVEAMMEPRTLGSDDAPIKVIEYSSLTCGHCAAFHHEDLKAIQSEYIDTGKVQFTFKEMPLNPPAIDASKLLRCMPKERFVNFMTLLFDEQSNWAYKQDYLTSLKQYAKLAGLSDEGVDSCLKNAELERRIVGDMQAASEKFKVQSTPTFIVNDGAKTIVGHQPMSVFKETFDSILNGASAPAAAPETMPEENPAE